MATITINIPVDKEDWVLSGLSTAYGYQDTIDNPLFDGGLPEDPIENPLFIPNPQSLQSFVKEKIIEKIKYDVQQGHISKHWEDEGANADAANIT